MDFKSLKFCLTITICFCGGFLLLNQVLPTVTVIAQKSSKSLVNPLLNQDEECFCQLKGRIDDCKCSIDTVDYFNNKKIYPRLQGLLKKNYFKYFQYNTHKKCPFWDTSLDKCSSLSCGVKSCSVADLPPGKNISSVEPNIYFTFMTDNCKSDIILKRCLKSSFNFSY